MSEEIDFKTKYLIYKSKYINLKKNNQIGGNNENKDNIILFKSENCGHCTKFMPTWNILKNKYSSKHNFITYDNNTNPDKMKEYDIEGVPTIYREKGNNKYIFTGERNIDNLIAFLN